MSGQFGTRHEGALGATGNPLLQDQKGAWRTLSLFRETNTTKMDPVATLKPFSLDALPSAKELYLEVADPTEYGFALAFLGSWEHWQRLIGCAWFQEYLIDWRDTLEVKMRSQGVLSISKIAAGSSPGALNASRWLAERGWSSKKRGRPSQLEVDAERQKQAQMAAEVEGDLERISETTH